MSRRRRQWLAAAVALVCVLAALTGWLSYVHARSTPRYLQLPPGEAAVTAPDGGMPLRLTSLTVTPQLVTDRDAYPAPANAVWVIAVVDYTPPAGGGSCHVDLLAVDGRRWSSLSSFDYEGSRVRQPYCSETPGAGATRAEFIYRIPEDAAGSLAGLTSAVTGYRGTEPDVVLTPPG